MCYRGLASGGLAALEALGLHMDPSGGSSSLPLAVLRRRAVVPPGGSAPYCLSSSPDLDLNLIRDYTYINPDTLLPLRFHCEPLI